MLRAQKSPDTSGYQDPFERTTVFFLKILFFFPLKRRFEWQSGLAEAGLSLWPEEGGWERKWGESGYAGRRAGASPGKSTCPGPKRSPGLGWACRLPGYSRTNKQPRLPGIWADQIFCRENGNTAEKAQLWSLFHPPLLTE